MEASAWLLALVYTFPLLLVGWVCLSQWWHRRTARHLTAFLTLIQRGQADAFFAALHPGIQDKVDKPALAALMASVRNRLGESQKVVMDTLFVETKRVSAGNILRVEALVKFEKEDAQCEVSECAGKLCGFRVRPTNDEPLKLSKFVALAPYQAKAEHILQQLFDGKTDEVISAMHPSLAKKFTAEKLREDVEKVKNAVGGLKERELAAAAAALVDQERLQQPDGISFTFGVEGNQPRRSITACVKFAFEDLRAVVLAFNLEAKIEPENVQIVEM
eukprot:TRINITY_DN53767_c0_g1_i1.p1 TRINITY_DN53767_c0_g1~~TRINITY_DN53767_c0_g1_i1.p1  ORF type:complete len:275 (-),score=63.07 TRINITY_DN53767_c0_g1_i1:14-838(-)